MECLHKDCNEELEDITSLEVELPTYRHFGCKEGHIFRRRKEVGEKPQWDIQTWLPLHESSGVIDWIKLKKAEEELKAKLK